MCTFVGGLEGIKTEHISNTVFLRWEVLPHVSINYINAFCKLPCVSAGLWKKTKKKHTSLFFKKKPAVVHVLTTVRSYIVFVQPLLSQIVWQGRNLPLRQTSESQICALAKPIMKWISGIIIWESFIEVIWLQFLGGNAYGCSLLKLNWKEEPENEWSPM